MGFEKLQVEHRDGVTTLRLDDPATLNAVSSRMMTDLDDALTEAVGSSRAIILTGVGRAFSSGAALNGSLDLGDGGEPDYGITLEREVNPLMIRLRELPIPWISAVRGAAAGVGCALALAGDLIIASETAYFVQAFVRIGLVPDGGSSHLLARGMTRARAMEMMLLGEKLTAQQALDWGLINRVVPDDELDAAAFALARRLADGPTVALGLIRRNAWAALDGDWTTALRNEREAQRTAGRTRDVAEGVAAFMEKRPPRFQGL